MISILRVHNKRVLSSFQNSTDQYRGYASHRLYAPILQKREKQKKKKKNHCSDSSREREISDALFQSLVNSLPAC